MELSNTVLSGNVNVRLGRPRRAMLRGATLFAGVAAIAGCDAAEPASEGRAQLSISGTEAKNLKATIGEVKVGGDCAFGAPSVAKTEDATGLTLVFSEALAGRSSGSCKLTMDMDVPNGYQFSFARLQYRGYGAAAQFSRTYSFGSGANWTFQNQISGDFEMEEPLQGLWSPSCGDTQRVQFAIELNAALAQDTSQFMPYSLDLRTDWASGNYWKSCHETGLVTVDPAEEGEECGGLQPRGCASPWVCQLHANSSIAGTCVDLNKMDKMPPAQQDEGCGGHLRIKCRGEEQQQLTCWYPDQQSRNDMKLGTCLTPVGSERSPCNHGVPSISCRSDLFCYEQVCVAADGSLNSLCGDGLPKCKDGLFCGGNNCIVSAHG